MGKLSPVWSKITDLRVSHASGVFVYDVEGNEYLDCTSGIAVTSTGHCHPRVVQAIADQASRFIHSQVNIYRNPILEDLADVLDEVTPAGIDTFFFSNSGAEAVEAAVKLSKHATGRNNIVVFQGSFHGRTAQAMAMTTSRTGYRVGYGSLPYGVFVSLFPGFPRSSGKEPIPVDQALDYFDYLLEAQTAPRDTAAVIIEPVLGEGGYIPAPKEFILALRERTSREGILLIADEVQTGFGRTGKMFAIEHYGISPDILVMGKGIASGFPFSGIGASEALMNSWVAGSHGGTYGGNPIGAAAAIATVKVLREERLVENAAERGAQLADGLRKVSLDSDYVGNVRALGLMVAVDLVDPATGKPNANATQRVLAHMLKESRVVCMNAGTFGNVIRFMPPLIVTREHVDRIVESFRVAVDALG